MYQLAAHCRVVYGTRRAALCDLESGEVYSVNHIAAEVLRGEREDPRFWAKLAELGLAGRARSAPCSPGPAPEVGLEFMWLEITSECNLFCRHCYGCFGSPDPHAQELQYEDWVKVLREGFELGCREVQLTGGEFFKFPQALELMRYAASLGFGLVEIFTNGTLVTPEIVSLVEELGIHMAVSLYSDQHEVHDAVTQVPGSFEQTFKTLTLLQKAGVPTRVATVVLSINQHMLESTQALVESMRFEVTGPDVLRPTGKGIERGLMPCDEVIRQYATCSKPDFRTSREGFARAHYYNSCWAGRLAVGSEGTVYPCIFARNHPVGRLGRESLTDLVAGTPLQTLWRITKDDVEVCKGCEYRYVCEDCRPLAEAVGGNLYDPSPRCNYRPDSGEWVSC